MNGAWIQTYTGRKINVFAPNPRDIKILDIAHALSNICRFTGHCRQFYSVAEHSFYVSEMVDSKYALQGLLHDAAEAYLCDVPRPIKPNLLNYKEIEDRLTSIIFARFGLDPKIPQPVKIQDARLCLTEGHYLMPSIKEWELAKVYKPIFNFNFELWSPKVAKRAFIYRFIELSDK